MKNYNLKKYGIELTEAEMQDIHDYYTIQCTADYIAENHPLWNTQKVQFVARETRRQMDKYGLDEEDAIECAQRVYNEKILQQPEFIHNSNSKDNIYQDQSQKDRER